MSFRSGGCATANSSYGADSHWTWARFRPILASGLHSLGALMRAVALITLVVLSGAGSAGATEATGPAPSSLPEVLSPILKGTVEARAAADAELAKAEAADLFDNITEDDHPAVRHKASGMVCTAADDRVMPIQVYAGSPRGDDVSCGSRTEDITTTTYATRYADGLTAQDALDGSIAAIRQIFQDVTPYSGDAVSTTRAGLPVPLTARFVARFKGQPVFTRTSTVAVGDWIIAQRVTAPIDKAMLADLVAELGLVSTLTGMSTAPAGEDH